MGVQGAAAGIYSAAVFSALVTFSTTSSTAAAMARYVCRGWYLLTISPTIGRTTLSVLATLPIFYAICMRNHRIIIGNVAEGSVTCANGKNLPPLFCTNLLGLATFPIFYAICMRNHRIIIGNVAGGRLP